MQLPSFSLTAPRSSWQIQRTVVFALVVRELKARVGSQWIGMMWLVFEPLANVAMILLVYTVVRHTSRPGQEVPVFLVVGLLPFFTFRNLALRVGDAVSSNRGLFAYRHVKPADTLAARAIVEVLLNTLVYATLLIGLGLLGYQWLPRAPMELIGVSVLILCLGFGMALVISVATLNRPKVRSVVGLMFFPMYLLSGVLFPLQSAPPAAREWLLWNPVLHLIELSRHEFLDHYPLLDRVSVGYAFICSVGVLALGLAMYRLERHRLRAGF